MGTGWIPVKVETSFWSTQRAFQLCSGNSMMAVDSGCKWQTKKVAMSARCHKSHVTWFRVGFPLSWWEKGSVNHTIFHPNFWKKRWTFVQGAQQQQTTTAQGQDGLPWTCQAKRRCHRDVGEGLSSHHFFDIAIIESNLNIYVLDAKLFDFFSVKKTRFFSDYCHCFLLKRQLNQPMEACEVLVTSMWHQLPGRGYRHPHEQSPGQQDGEENGHQAGPVFWGQDNFS